MDGQTGVPLPMLSPGSGNQSPEEGLPAPGPTGCKIQTGACLKSPLPEAALLDPCPAPFSHRELVRDLILQVKRGG